MAKKWVTPQEFIKGYTKKGLENLVYNWSKKANKKLQELEKTGFNTSSNAYKYLEKIAIGEQSNDILQSHKIRFRSTRKDLSSMSRETLEKEYYKLWNYLKSKTSTVKGIKNVIKKGYEAYTEEYDSNLTQQEYSEYFENAKVDILKNLYGSGQLNELLQKYSEKDALEITNKIVKQYEEEEEKATKHNQTFNPDEIFTQEHLNDILKGYEEI